MLQSRFSTLLPPLMPVVVPEPEHKQQEPSTTMKSAFPPRSSSNRSRRKKAVEEQPVISSPETPESRPIAATSTIEEDLAFADFSTLDDFFREVSPVESAYFSKLYPEGEVKPEQRFCVLPAAGFFRRKKKLPSVDVASVGNASDTMVSVSSHTHLTGRELHEKAKVGSNERDLCFFCFLAFF
jgi:hypothetical protein